MSPTVRDRTQEFFATVDSFQELSRNNVHPQAAPKSSPSSSATLSHCSIEESKRIQLTARKIAESIDEASHKIMELEQLAKLTSNFRDERPKIQSLMMSIKQDTEALNVDLNTLKTCLAQSFGDISNRTHHCIEHHQSLLKVLQVRYSNLAKLFAAACEVSTKHLQRQKQQREKFGFSGAKKQTFRKVPMNRLQRRRSTRGRGDTGTNSESELLLPSNGNAALDGYELKGASQSQSQMVMYQETQYNEQRAMEAETIERQMTDISQMMTRMAGMVHEQKQTIIDIGGNVDQSIENVEGAIAQLQKYLSTLSGNRWLMIKVFGLLIFLAIVFTLFIA